MLVDCRGQRRRLPRKTGTAHLLAGAVQRGTIRQDAVALAEALESCGACFAAGAREDAVVLCLGCMAADAAPLLEGLREMVRTPRLAPLERLWSQATDAT